MELILPRAQLFHEGVDSLQQWFMSVEQSLGELRNAERVMLHLPEARDRAKVRRLYMKMCLLCFNIKLTCCLKCVCLGCC